MTNSRPGGELGGGSAAGGRRRGKTLGRDPGRAEHRGGDEAKRDGYGESLDGQHGIGDERARRDPRARVNEAGSVVEAVLLLLVMVLGVVLVRVDGAVVVAVDVGRVHGVGERMGARGAIRPEEQKRRRDQPCRSHTFLLTEAGPNCKTWIR